MFRRLRYTFAAALHEWRHGENSRKALAEFRRKREEAREAAFAKLSDKAKQVIASSSPTDDELSLVLAEIEAMPDLEMMEAGKILFADARLVRRDPAQKFAVRVSSRMAALAK